MTFLILWPFLIVFQIFLLTSWTNIVVDMLTDIIFDISRNIVVDIVTCFILWQIFFDISRNIDVDIVISSHILLLISWQILLLISWQILLLISWQILLLISWQMSGRSSSSLLVWSLINYCDRCGSEQNTNGWAQQGISVLTT